MQMKYACADIELVRTRLKQLERDCRTQASGARDWQTAHDQGIGALTAACFIGEVGDPARFRSAGALASYVGAVPRLRQSGKRAISSTRTIPLGNAR